MKVDKALTDLLACPRCDQAVVADEGQITCPGCRNEFPLLAGVPFLFADPPTALAQWRERLNLALRKLDHDAKAAQQAAQRPDIKDKTRARLELLCDGSRQHAQELRTLLTPLEIETMQANFETALALRTRMPSDQGLTTYYANLHRDWCWGEEENALSCRLVVEALNGHEASNMLTLGAGGGRLAYDLHMSLEPALTVALDFNPLLVLAAARLVAGESLQLHEFPIAPRDSTDVAIARTLRAPARVRDGFYLLLASALRAPFRRGRFDTLVTPWLCDILPESLPQQAARWNALLKPGGRWVWFGSHAFRSASPADNPGISETCDIIESAGFARPQVHEADIPYMASPASRHARRERVVVIHADKVRDVPRPKRHNALPEWLVSGKQPVPTTESFRVQAVSTRIHAFIMAMIDGKRSIEDMAVLLEEQRLMPRAEGEAAVRNFLIRMHEDGERYSGL